MSTPHIGANANDFAKTVLMPGDPLRAKFIADTFLTDVKLVTSVRNIFGYTGYYKGKKVSVMASGMGMPSMGIYSYELYKYYNVETIIRIGTCGSYKEYINLFDVLIICIEKYFVNLFSWFCAFLYTCTDFRLSFCASDIPCSISCKKKHRDTHFACLCAFYWAIYAALPSQAFRS